MTFVLALALRLGFVLAYPQVPVVDDAAWYDQAASRLASGQEGRAASFARGPVYVLFLASIYRVAGHDQTAARIAQAIISALTILLIYALGRAVFNETVGVIASLLAAGYPAFISYPGWLLTETLSAGLLPAFVYSLIRAWQRPRMSRWVATGLLGGLMALHRSELLLVAVLSLVAGGVWRVGVGRLGACALAAALMVLPWAIRNYLLVGEFTTATSPGSGHVLWISTMELQGPEWDPHAPYMREYEALVAGATSPREADRRLRHDAIRRILAHPLRYAKLCAKRIPAFWIGGHGNTFLHLEGGFGAYLAQRAYGKAAVKLAMLIYNLGIIALGFVGLHLACTLGTVDPRPVVWMAIPLAVKALTHVALFAALRYQVPIMPFLIVFAAFAIWHVRHVVREIVPVPS